MNRPRPWRSRPKYRLRAALLLPRNPPFARLDRASLSSSRPTAWPNRTRTLPEPLHGLLDSTQVVRTVLEPLQHRGGPQRVCPRSPCALRRRTHGVWERKDARRFCWHRLTPLKVFDEPRPDPRNGWSTTTLCDPTPSAPRQYGFEQLRPRYAHGLYGSGTGVFAPSAVAIVPESEHLPILCRLLGIGTRAERRRLAKRQTHVPRAVKHFNWMFLLLSLPRTENRITMKKLFICGGSYRRSTDLVQGASHCVTSAARKSTPENCSTLKST